MIRAFAIMLSLSGCMSTNATGHPTVQIATGYVATICESSVSLYSNGRMAGVQHTTRWGCAEVKR